MPRDLKLVYVLVMSTSACCLEVHGANELTTTGTSGGSITTSGGTTTGGRCVIAGQSYRERATNPVNAAECCNPAISPGHWLPLFTKTQSFAVGSSTVSFGNNDAILGDLNHDGIADALLTAYVGPNSISQGWAYLSSPQGFVGPVVCGAQDPGEVWPGSPAIGDMNGDGKPDIVMSTDDSVEVFLAAGNGQFGSELFNSLGGSCFGAWLKVADVNSDGWPDVIAATGYCGLEVFLNGGKGDGVLQPPQTLGATLAGSRLSVGDFNDDGYLDVSFVGANGDLQWIPGSAIGFTGASRSFGLFGTHGQAVFPWGRADAMATATDSSLNVFLPSDGGPQPPSTYPIDVPIGDVQAGDLDGDGQPDIVVASGYNHGESLDIFVNDGRGLFGTAGDFPLLSQWNVQRIALGDLNGDGALDLAVFRSAGPWEIWINTCGPGAAQTIADAGMPL